MGFNPVRIHSDIIYLDQFISAQEEMSIVIQLIPPHNWLQELLPLPKTDVSCCN